MLNFYNLPQSICIALTMISAFCVIMQSMVLVLNLNRYCPNRIQKAENILEIVILLHTLLLSLLISQVQNSMREDLITPTGYATARLAIFALAAGLAGILFRYQKTWEIPLTIVAAALTLPVMEKWLENIFPLLYGTSMLYFLLRSIYIIARRQREFKTSISESSVKEAIDALHTGILFCEPDGHIVLINRRMQELMTFLTGTMQRNGLQFYQHITKGCLCQDDEEVELNGHMVCRLPDGSVWMFTDTTLYMGKKHYWQISAADVTEQWNSTAKLRQQNIELDQKKQELKDTIKNLKTIYRKEETLRTKSRIHDILGQRIAVLIRTLRENDKPDESLLRAFADGLPMNLYELMLERSVQHEIEAMTEMFAGIGVRVSFHGQLPENRMLAAVFADIITESVTNAVRHGFATHIDITCEITDPAGWVLRISNTGIPPHSPISEGSGITNMRRRLMGLGGRLDIETHPKYILTASLPAEEVKVRFEP